MTVFRRPLSLLLLIFFLFWVSPLLTLAQETPPQMEAMAPMELLQQKNQQLHQQLRDARREIAQIRTEGSAPGWQEVVTGLGIIFGLSGVVMMVTARWRLTRR